MDLHRQRRAGVAAAVQRLDPTENARVAVVWNGTTVHDNGAIDGSTGGAPPKGRRAGPVRLQDQGDPGANVR